MSLPCDLAVQHTFSPYLSSGRLSESLIFKKWPWKSFKLLNHTAIPYFIFEPPLFQARHRERRRFRSLSPKRRSTHDYMSDGAASEGYPNLTQQPPYHRGHRGHRASRPRKRNYYVYDGNRTPSPAYTETKASILRRRKNHKPNENEEEDLEEVLRGQSIPLPLSQPQQPRYASLQDLSRGLAILPHHSEGVPFSKHHSTSSLNNQASFTGRNSDLALNGRPSAANLSKHPQAKVLRRQNSEPLGNII